VSLIFDPALVEQQLGTRQLGRRIACLPATRSTNDELWRLVEAGEAVTGLVVVTDQQQAGRGRQGRPWTMGTGLGLACSVLLYPTMPRDRWSLLSLAAGVAVAAALGEEGVAARLKWPNDILIEGRKVGGILTEARSTPLGQAVVIGLGLNVNEQPADFPAGLRDRAISLRMVTGTPVRREPILARILNGLETLLQADGHSITKRWREYCAHMGRPVRFHHGQDIIAGLFLDVNELGQARLKIGSRIVLVSSGQLEWTSQPTEMKGAEDAACH